MEALEVLVDVEAMAVEKGPARAVAATVEARGV